MNWGDLFTFIIVMGFLLFFISLNRVKEESNIDMEKEILDRMKKQQEALLLEKQIMLQQIQIIRMKNDFRDNGYLSQPTLEVLGADDLPRLNCLNTYSGADNAKR